MIAWVQTYDEDDEDNQDNAQGSRVSTGQQITQVQPHVSDNQQENLGEATIRVSFDGYIDTNDDNSRCVTDRKPEIGFFGGYREPVRGRKWDYARDSSPVIVQTRTLQRILPWRAYIESSTCKPLSHVDSTELNNVLLSQQSPRYQIPWRGDLKVTENYETHSSLYHPAKQRKSLIRRIQVRSSISIFC